MKTGIKQLFYIIAVLISLSAFGQSNWPKIISVSNGGKITIYQPQPETFEGHKVTGRAAISVIPKTNAEPIFGAMWFEALLSTDKGDRTATLESFKVTRSKFADSTSQQKLDTIQKLIEQEVPKWNMEISLDELLTSIQHEQTFNDAGLNTDPPKIIYTKKSTTLVTIDGKPNIRKDESLNMDRVINSPFLIVKPSGKKYFVYAAGYWYASKEVSSGYTYSKKIPKSIKELDKKIKKLEKENENLNKGDRAPKPPEVIVTTVPTELIQTEGEATYKNIEGTSLLYADNTLDEIFKDIGTQKTFIVLSGRWYSAPNLEGPWVYTPSDQLPADFAKIPGGSVKDGVLAYVAGTPEAEEAKIDAQIPQTVKVDRKTAKTSVTYDGEPKFSKVENTSLQVSENSNVTVVRDESGKYYAVDNGIWFVSSSPKGPWQVADDRPKGIELIPASNQAYNTKYVYVYDATPTYVYMGYTPGYMGSYVYGPTVVYGTGFYYAPWYGTMYYPYPMTYGFGFGYNPWYGWGMAWGMAFSFGWFSMGFYGGGYWGPPMYHPPCHGWGYRGGYYPNRPPGDIANRPGDGGNRPGGGNRPSQLPSGGANRPSQLPAGGANRPSQQPAISNRPSSQPSVSQRPANINNNAGVSTRDRNNLYNNRSGTIANNRPSTRPSTGVSNNMAGGNNVLADRDGNVYRRDNNGSWSKRENQSWNGAGNDRSRDLDRGQYQRDRGANRNYNYQNNYRSQPSRSSYGGGGRSYGGGGGMRGGGGGRRR